MPNGNVPTPVCHGQCQRTNPNIPDPDVFPFNAWLPSPILFSPEMFDSPVCLPIKTFALLLKLSFPPACSPRKIEFPVPVCQICPATSSFAPGEEVPIPVLPELLLYKSFPKIVQSPSGPEAPPIAVQTAPSQ